MMQEEHFDRIAKDYDFWKEKNHYYYENLIALYRSFIPKQSSVLEIGCGTGNILASLEPREGRGIDVSSEMIKIAKEKNAPHTKIVFEREDILDSNETFRSDYIFLADVLEHVDDLPRFLNQLAARTMNPSKVIISVANPLWEPLLMVTEKLKMKMPEGPHKRFSIRETEELFKKAGFKLQEKGYRLLVPKKMPGANWINERFFKNKLMERFGFIVYWVLAK